MTSTWTGNGRSSPHWWWRPCSRRAEVPGCPARDSADRVGAGMSDDRAVRFVCTDRGTHPSRELAVMRLREPEEDPGLLAQLRSRLTPERAEELYAVEIIDQMLRDDRS